MDLAQMTGAAGTIHLGGRTILLRRLTFRNRAQLTEYLKAHTPRPMAAVAEALRELEPLKAADPETYAVIRAQMVDLAYKDTKAGALASSESLRVMLSMEGQAFWLWLRAREEQPDITSPEAMLALMEQEDPAELERKLDELATREREADAAATKARGDANPPQPARK
jgi:hypothetical protein